MTRSDPRSSFLAWLFAHPHLAAVRVLRRGLDPDQLSPDSRVEFSAFSSQAVVRRTITYRLYSNLVAGGYLVDVLAPLLPRAADLVPHPPSPVSQASPAPSRTRARTLQPKTLLTDPGYSGRDV